VFTRLIVGLLIAGFSTLGTPALSAQEDAGDGRSVESDILDRMRGAEAVSYADAARAALAAAGRLDLGDLSATESGRSAEEELPLRRTQLNDPVTSAQFAFFVMEAFDIPGGLMYRLLPSPRYAIRELRFRDLMAEELEARELITGRSALTVLSRTRAWVTERGDALSAAAPSKGGS
jgi:hypothetical protein